MIAALRPLRSATAPASRLFGLPRRLWLALGLALSLLLAQQIALQHSVNHLAEQTEQGQRQRDKAHQTTEQCAQCLALASLTGAPPAQQTLPSSTASHETRCHTQPATLPFGGCFPFASRAPPVFPQ